MNEDCGNVMMTGNQLQGMLLDRCSVRLFASDTAGLCGSVKVKDMCQAWLWGARYVSHSRNAHACLPTSILSVFAYLELVVWMNTVGVRVTPAVELHVSMMGSQIQDTMPANAELAFRVEKRFSV